MARKKTTTVVEEEAIENPEPEIKEVNYLEDVKGKKITEPIVEDKPEAIVEEVPEPTPTPVEEDKPEPIDPEKIRLEAEAKAQEEVTKRMITALKGDTEEQTETNVNAYQKLVQDAAREGRTPRWDEVLPLMEEATIQRLDARNAQREAETKAQQEIQQKQEQTEVERFNQELDDGLADLYKSNKLPKIRNAEDPNDVGLVARQSLFDTMAKVNTERVKNGQPPIRDIVRIHSIYYKAPTTQPAGADAPVAGSNRSGNNMPEDSEINYLRDVKGATGTNKPWWRRGF